jgi:hypothetical protein
LPGGGAHTPPRHQGASVKRQLTDALACVGTVIILALTVAPPLRTFAIAIAFLPVRRRWRQNGEGDRNALPHFKTPWAPAHSSDAGPCFALRNGLEFYQSFSGLTRAWPSRR